ncbi:UNKNOWN [Stylonychia lemnae]|uniref:Uncharacterized protein n=1 Tax=Stylonychia lemnae TaxID=5949 RepID=A0A078AXQ9_STYLE|nr:UNKNOWN [Stylonychia lemnae]|eukprot:CDW86944.1 UNKNOWN [Stylonychia lemnae]
MGNNCCKQSKSGRTMQSRKIKSFGDKPLLLNKYPGIFIYQLKRDSSESGRFEVTLFSRAKYFYEKINDGTQIHSKESGQGLPNSDWSGFQMRIELALEQGKEKL